MRLSLVRRAQAGDQRAFEQLMEQHATDIYRLSTAIGGEADTRDVTEEAFEGAKHDRAKVAFDKPPVSAA